MSIYAIPDGIQVGRVIIVAPIVQLVAFVSVVHSGLLQGAAWS